MATKLQCLLLQMECKNLDRLTNRQMLATRSRHPSFQNRLKTTWFFRGGGGGENMVDKNGRGINRCQNITKVDLPVQV